MSFLRRILPQLPAPTMFGSNHFYFAVGLGGSDNRPTQIACSTYEQVESHCKSFSAQGRNAYMALSSFTSFMTRKASAAYEVRCLWADIDAGKTNSTYANMEQALAALVKFSNETGLKPNIIVSSGKGIHAYWTFTKNIPAAVWKQMARFFHAVCKAKGLDVDPTRAEDLSSVLRLPGTIHQSSGAEVKVIYDDHADYEPRALVKLMAPHIPVSTESLRSVSQPIAQPAPVSMDSDPNAALARTLGITAAPTNTPAESIVPKCAQLSSMGTGMYPQWFNAMSVLKRCINGREWVHKLSAMDESRYDYQQTDAKFDMAADDMPALCSTFAAVNPQPCMNCRYRGRVKTPLMLSMLPDETQPAPAPTIVTESSVPAPETPSPASKFLGMNFDLPQSQKTAQSVIEAAEQLSKPLEHLVMGSRYEYPRVPIKDRSWLVDNRGIVYLSPEKDSNGEVQIVERVICTSQLWFKHSIYEEPEEGRVQRSYVFEAVYPNGRTAELRFRVKEDLSNDACVRWFANANMYPTAQIYTGKYFMAFMNAYLRSVVHAASELLTFDRFGWTEYVDPRTQQRATGFVVGSGIITADGMRDAAYSPKIRKPAKTTFQPKGTLEAWKDAPRMYRVLKQYPAQLAMCLSLAAPLMQYGLGEARSATYSLWSNTSGKGKTTVLRMAASVWGDPREQFISREASNAARSHKLATLNNLPVFLDEMTDVRQEDMYNLAYTLVGGKEKDKMRSSGAEMVDTGAWSTVTFTTANNSFKAAISKQTGDSDASLLRVIEYECDFPNYDDKPAVRNYIRGCMDVMEKNYGVAGPEFVYQLLRHPERLLTLNHKLGFWFRSNGFAEEERFLGSPLGLAMYAGRWAVEWGILDYDMDELERWVLGTFVPHNRIQTQAFSPDFEGILAEYLVERQNNVLQVAQERRPATMTDPGLRGVPDQYIISMPMREVFIRASALERMVTISRSDFQQWLKGRNVSPQVILNNLRDAGYNIKETTRCLGQDVKCLAMPRTHCIVLDRDAANRLGFNFQSKQEAK